MVTFNDSHLARADNNYSADAHAPARVIGFTPHMQSKHEDVDSKHAMTDCDHALMERLLLEMRQRSEV